MSTVVPQAVYGNDSDVPCTLPGLSMNTSLLRTDCPRTLYALTPAGTPRTMNRYLADTRLPAKDCSWTVHSRPTDCSCSWCWKVHGQSTAASRTVHGLSSNCLRIPMRYSWTTHRLSMDAPQTVHGHPRTHHVHLTHCLDTRRTIHKHPTKAPFIPPGLSV